MHLDLFPQALLRQPPALVLVLALVVLGFGCGPKLSQEVAGSLEKTAAESADPATVWTTLPAPVDFVPARRLVAGFLVVNGVFNSELMAPYDIFQHTIFHTEQFRQEGQEDSPGIDVFVVSPDGQPITTFEGIEIVPHHSFDSAPAIDILVVPSAENSMTSDLDNQVLIDWVRAVGQEADFVLSLCDGAFVLAQAGLLDGYAVTTFPGDQDKFAERFPHLDLRREISFVHDGRRLTSAGGAKSYDVAMYLVAHLYGDSVARGVGGGLILDWPPRPGTMPAVLVGD